MRTFNLFTAFLVTLLLSLTSLFFSPLPANALPSNPKVDPAKIDAAWNSLSDEQKKVANYVMSNLTSEGYSREAAAAIGGNFWQESTWNPTLENSIGACGLYQALDRRKHLLDVAGVSSCSQLTPEGTMKAYHDDKSNYNLLGSSSNSVIYGEHSAHALDGAAEAGVSGATIPAQSESFGSPEAFKTTKDWYFATWIFVLNWERPGGAESMFMKRTLYAATLLAKADGVSSSSSPASSSQSGASSLGSSLPSEWDLEGMPAKPSVPEGTTVPESKYNDLSVGQKVNVGDIKDNLSDGFWGTIVNVTRIALVIVGILFYAYAVLLVASLALDITNPSVGAFSLTTLKLASYDPDSGLMTPILVIFSVIILAALLQTGYLLRVVLYVTDFLVSLI